MKDILAHIKRVETETQTQSLLQTTMQSLLQPALAKHQSLLQTALAKHQAQMFSKVSAIVESVAYVNRCQEPAAGDGGGGRGAGVDHHRQSPVVMTSDVTDMLAYLAEIRSPSLSRARAHSHSRKKNITLL